jgi:DNA-binding LacI/PurR family transcriptional regulator
MAKNQKSKNKVKPHYLGIADNLEKKIRSKSYLPGKKLPSIEELTEEYNVHRNTVKSAFKTLREKGLVRNYPGVGIVVREDLKLPLNTALILPYGHNGIVALLIGLKESLKNYDSSIEIMLYKTSEEQVRYLNQVKEKDFSGLVIRPDFSGSGYDAIRKFQDEKFPIVAIENFHSGVPGHYVDSGAFDAAHLAVKHLKDIGRLPAGIVYSDDKFGESFFEGYKQAHFESKEDCRRIYVKSCADSDSAASASLDMMALKTPPHSIIFSDPGYAVAAYNVFKEHAVDLRRLRLISFGEINNGEFFEYRIITIKRNLDALGEKAGKLLLELLDAPRRRVERRIDKVAIELKI